MNDLQKEILEIFKIVHRICEQNELSYYAVGGTAIGAVRHNGFIPWDDDMDIAMPIEDYCFFKRHAQELLPDGYEFYSYENSPRYAHVFGKIINNNTTYIEESNMPYPKAYSGVWIDIMPMSGVPAPSKERHHFLNKLRILGSLD